MRKAITAALLASLLIPLAQAGAEAGRVESSVYRVTKTKVMRNSGDHPTLEENFSFTLLDNRGELMELTVMEEDITVSAGYDQIEVNGTPHRRWARIVGIGSIAPGEELEVEGSWVIRIESYPKVGQGDVGGAMPGAPMKYAEPVENVWHSDEDPIENTALELTENVDGYLQKARRIFDFVQDRLEYRQQAIAHGDIWVYHNGEGDCTEYANLFISMARAAGIPTKFVSGYHHYFEGEETPGSLPRVSGHAFASVYLPGAGWTPMDPTEAYGGGGGNFAGIDSRYIIEMLSDGSDMEMGGTSEVPGGQISWTSNPGEPTSIEFVSEETGTTIEPLAALMVDIISSEENPENLGVSVRISNEGASTADGIEVKFEADNRYFGVHPKERVLELGPGEEEIAEFDLVPKESVEEEQVKVTGSFSSAEHGELRSEDLMTITTELSPDETPATDPIESLKGFLEKYFYLIMLIGIVVAGVGFAARR